MNGRRSQFWHIMQVLLSAHSMPTTNSLSVLTQSISATSPMSRTLRACIFCSPAMLSTGYLDNFPGFCPSKSQVWPFYFSLLSVVLLMPEAELMASGPSCLCCHRLNILSLCWGQVFLCIYAFEVCIQKGTHTGD